MDDKDESYCGECDCKGVTKRSVPTNKDESYCGECDTRNKYEADTEIIEFDKQEEQRVRDHWKAIAADPKK
jgi:hypothetical protein